MELLIYINSYVLVLFSPLPLKRRVLQSPSCFKCFVVYNDHTWPGPYIPYGTELSNESYLRLNHNTLLFFIFQPLFKDENLIYRLKWRFKVTFRNLRTFFVLHSFSQEECYIFFHLVSTKQYTYAQKI